MKKVLTMAVLLTLAALPAWAGGIGIMYSSWDADELGSDEGLGIKVEFDFGSFVNFDIRGSWLDELGIATQDDVLQLEAMPLDVGLSVDFFDDKRLQPFLGGGLTFVFLNAKIGDDSIARTNDEAGYYAVAGLRGMVTKRFAIFGEVLHREVNTEFTSDGFQGRDFEDFGADLGGLQANIGLTLAW